MTHEEDAVKYAGTDIDFEWHKRDFKSWHESLLEDLLEVEAKKAEHEMINGTLEIDGEVIAEVKELTFDSSSLIATGTAFYFNRINCTYNNYKSNKKALIL